MCTTCAPEKEKQKLVTKTQNRSLNTTGQRFVPRKIMIRQETITEVQIIMQ